MKNKLILMLCVAALTLSFASCGDTDKGSNDTASSAASTSAAADSEAATESAAEAESVAETESAAEESAAETESKADENKTPASNEELTELLAKVKEKTADNSNCEMTAKMDIDMAMTMSGTNTNIKTTSDITSKTNGKNSHTITTTTTDQGTGAMSETQEIYQTEDGTNYVSTDEGKTWTKNTGASSSFDASAFSGDIMGEDAVFQNATLEKDGDNYVITVSFNDLLANAGEAAESLLGMTGGAEAEGNVILTIGSDYYPVSMTMENISFDMSELLSALASEDAGDASIDMKMNMTINFVSWGTVSDEDVAVPEAALSAE